MNSSTSLLPEPVVMNLFRAYIPMDRRRELSGNGLLDSQSRGAVLFADISGFTALTELMSS